MVWTSFPAGVSYDVRLVLADRFALVLGRVSYCAARISTDVSSSHPVGCTLTTATIYHAPGVRAILLPLARFVVWDAGYRSGESLEVRTNQANKIFCELCAGHRVLFVGRYGQADVIFENFSHEAVYPTARIGQSHQDVGAIVAARQGTFDGLNVPANAVDAPLASVFLF